MIELSPETACMLYLFAAISLVLYYWYRSHKKMKKKEVLSYEFASKQCEFCHHSFVCPKSETLVRCPECHCITK